MITKILTSRHLPLGLTALAFLVVAIVGYILANQRDTARTLAAAHEQTIVSLKRTLADRDSSIAQRDALITRQNAGIDAIARARAEDRTAYVRQYAAADERAKSDDARSAQLLAQALSFTDELGECRAARALLEEELVQ